MKKSIIIILAVVAILVIWAVSVYNGLVTMDENVTGKWANVETQYQRRADLIPNLVNTVKGYATHEKETLEGVVADPAEIKKNLVAQLTASVRWTQSVKNMVADGATDFTECGPGAVLQGLIKKIDGTVNAHGIA